MYACRVYFIINLLTYLVGDWHTPGIVSSEQLFVTMGRSHEDVDDFAGVQSSSGG